MPGGGSLRYQSIIIIVYYHSLDEDSREFDSNRFDMRERWYLRHIFKPRKRKDIGREKIDADYCLPINQSIKLHSCRSREDLNQERKKKSDLSLLFQGSTRSLERERRYVTSTVAEKENMKKHRSHLTNLRSDGWGSW